MDSQRKWAFCRVEMVVVGVCAGLVLLVTLPGLTGAREAGKRAVCLANLKTLGAAALLYARDYEDKIPGWEWEFKETWYIDPGSWLHPPYPTLLSFFGESGYIWEYVQNKSPYTCPSLKNEYNPKPYINTWHSSWVWGWPGGEGTSNPPGPMWNYVLNAQAAHSMNDPQFRANPELVMPSPTSVMMLFEQDEMDYASFDNGVTLFNSTHGLGGDDSLGGFHMLTGVFVEERGSYTLIRKQGLGNMVFFDGHVGSMSSQEYRQIRSTPEGTLELCGGYYGFIWPGFE